MKQKAKKSAAHDKVEHMRTGGGTWTTEIDATEEKVLALLGNRATPLPNLFDSDSAYHVESGMKSFVQNIIIRDSEIVLLNTYQ
jgi:hypothetical protein